jgi:hypothetical protein
MSAPEQFKTEQPMTPVAIIEKKILKMRAQEIRRRGIGIGLGFIAVPFLINTAVDFKNSNNQYSRFDSLGASVISLGAVTALSIAASKSRTAAALEGALAQHQLANPASIEIADLSQQQPISPAE